jgi:pimeloyl-ACP methyl ester carboxylesterase
MKKILLKNGETIAYRESGSGKTLVLVHGNMTSSQHFDVLMSRLNGYHVIAIDMRGFGQSTYNEPVNSLRDFSEDIYEVLSVIGIEKAYFLGWSTGGGVVMTLAIDHPELVEGLFLVESVGLSGYPMFKKDENGQAILSELMTSKEEIANDPVQVLPILSAYQNKDKATLKVIWNMLIYTHNQPNEAQYEIYLEDMLTQRNLVDVDYSLVHFNISSKHNGVKDGTNEVKKITCPVTILQGRNDLVVPLMMGEEIHAGISHSQLILHEYGHSPFVDDMDFVLEQLYSFIK